MSWYIENVRTHIHLYGNTRNVISDEHNRKELLDRLDKIDYMLKWNKNKIDTLNSNLRDTTHPVHLFMKQDKARAELLFNHQVRERLIRMYNKTLNNLKL